MPPSEQDPREGWLHSDQLILPEEQLKPEEADAFLDFLFGSIAIKPKRLTLAETAGVARYLKALTLGMQGGDERELVTRAAEMLWQALFSVGQFRIAEKQQAIDFLITHSKTYLSSLDVHRMVQLVRGHSAPAAYEQAFRPPLLMGRNRSVQGQSKAQLQDDLTERIYVAYHALRGAKVRNARGRIAKALNRFGIETRARAKTDRKWGSAEVHERVRHFEERLTRKARPLPGNPDPRKQISRWRKSLASGWIHQFLLAFRPLRRP